MAATAAAVVGAGASVAGTAMSAKAQSDAAKRASAQAEFNPFDVSVGGGTATFSDNDSVKFTEDAASSAARGSLEGIQAGGFSGVDPTHLTQLGLMGQDFQNASLSRIGQDFTGVDNALTAAQGIDAAALGTFTDQTNQAMDSLGRVAGQGERAIEGAFGPGRLDNQSNAAIAGGFGLLNQNFDDVAADQLANLRASARPMEDRAVNSKFQNLFSSGRLGTTGGAQALGDLAQRQETADIDRQVASRGLATNLLNSNRQTGLGMLGQGFQGILGGQNANTSLAGTVGGLGSAATGMFGNLSQKQLSANQNFGDRTVSRAGLRLQNAENIFGFGSGLQDRSFNLGSNAFGLIRQLNTEGRNTIALGGNIGGQQATAGANQGSFTMQGAGSAVGAGLTGLGQGLLNSDFSSTPPPAIPPPTVNGQPGTITV